MFNKMVLFRILSSTGKGGKMMSFDEKKGEDDVF